LKAVLLSLHAFPSIFGGKEMSEAITVDQFRNLIQKACATLEVGASEARLEQEGRALRWLSPFVAVNPDRSEQDMEFQIDFEVTRVLSVMQEYQSCFVTITLYLVGGDLVPLPSTRDLLGSCLAEIDRLNREEPGVNFRFKPSEFPNEAWIVIESDVYVDGINERSLANALDRVLECAEARYCEVYEFAVSGN
jgi:hypothetical protein